ncbi:MAG: hypothetical protein U0V54_05585 [Saprospiraceae bacterium]|nr:hypothetical protein [Saprospiraceae bacterium]
MNFDPSGPDAQGQFKVDQDLKDIGVLNPEEGPSLGLESSISLIEKAKNIKYLLRKAGGRPSKIMLRDGLSLYRGETDELFIGMRDYQSWRLLITAYGHELVHKYHFVNEVYGKFGKTPLERKNVSESLAHYWSSQYSGIGIPKFNFYYNESK